MSNNLSTLSADLATQLRDTTHATWTSSEKDALIGWAVNRLYPAFPRPIDPTTTTITLVADTYFYALPSGVREVRAIERYNGTDEYGYIDGSAWEIVGDAIIGTGKIHITPVLIDSYAGDTIRVHGSGVYDTSTNLIPDEFVSFVLAMARGEAYRRMGGDRAQFLQWQARDQNQNISVSELIMLIREAEADVQLLKSMLGRGQRRPVPGRQ